MKQYELALVYRPNLSEEETTQENDSVKELLERFNAKITKVDDWGKRRLAYEIKKHTEGHYIFLQFEADANAPREIESRLRINENILRYLIVAKEA